MEHISTQMGAEQPALVETGPMIVWRVPVYISFPHVGKIGGVGVIEVDARTGEMIDPSGRKAEIEQYLEREVRPHLPPYQAVNRLPVDYLPERVASAPELAADDQE